MRAASLLDVLEERMSTQLDEVPTIEFVAPMPGFPHHRRFVLVRMDESGQLYELTSLDDPTLRFLVMSPVLFPDYAPEISEETLELLGVEDPGHILILLVVTADEAVGPPTANLLAPILIDQISRRASQVVLNGSGFPVRAGLIPSA